MWLGWTYSGTASKTRWASCAISPMASIRRSCATSGCRPRSAAAARRCIPPAALVADGIGRYTEEVEAAVYFCCLEGLQNVNKHAGSDATAVIRLWERDRRLYFEIADDGVGYDVESAPHAGQGLANMSDRIAALGGTLAVESTPGRGTTVRANIPVDDATTQRVGPVAHSGSEGSQRLTSSLTSAGGGSRSMLASSLSISALWRSPKRVPIHLMSTSRRRPRWPPR